MNREELLQDIKDDFKSLCTKKMALFSVVYVIKNHEDLTLEDFAIDAGVKFATSSSIIVTSNLIEYGLLNSIKEEDLTFNKKLMVRFTSSAASLALVNFASPYVQNSVRTLVVSPLTNGSISVALYILFSPKELDELLRNSCISNQYIAVYNRIKGNKYIDLFNQYFSTFM